MKKLFIIVIGIILIGTISYFIFHSSSIKNDGYNSTSDYKNATYTIDGAVVTLVDGISQIESAPGSASSFVTRYFGNEVRHDLNNDGREDVVFLISQETGGSATFFYVVAALNTPTGYVGSHAFFLGDRIAPQSTHIDEGKTARGSARDNVIVVNYADRLSHEPFSAEPSVGKSVWIKLDPHTMQFAEVAQHFEGESN